MIARIITIICLVGAVVCMVITGYFQWRIYQIQKETTAIYEKIR